MFRHDGFFFFVFGANLCLRNVGSCHQITSPIRIVGVMITLYCNIMKRPLNALLINIYSGKGHQHMTVSHVSSQLLHNKVDKSFKYAKILKIIKVPHL